ncbi:LysR family transcriptional regulator [Halalkalibacterium ligniniphilum]|uniref:LysR family transcriptional regulator n=1 Tax=Halalkalibacterium ligniniphilum TaxID=1134413 RepID=UPI000344EDB5|nr:LysR family transcriptional regulator [Halalkalibacterium ligniniphilum]
MDLELLKTFVKLAKVKSIQKASDELYVSQSSIINRIRVFEKEIGYKMFFRNGRGIELTPEGKKMLIYVQKTIKILNEGVEDLKNVKKTTGRIHLASISTAASYILPNYLQSFHQEHPHIGINVRTSISTTIIDWVINGKADLGIIKGPLFHNGVRSLLLSSDPIVLIVHVHHPFAQKPYVTPEDFKNETVLPFNRKSRYWSTIANWFDEHHIHPDMGMEFDHLETIKQLVFENEGIGFIPLAAVNDEESKETIKIVPLKPPLKVSRDTLLICNSKKPLSIHSQQFWDYIACTSIAK